jgi:hypothetical protein
MADEERLRSSDNGQGTVDRDRLREEIHLLETSLGYWQARWQHTPGPSGPGTPRGHIRQTIDLLPLRGGPDGGLHARPTREPVKGGEVDGRVPVRDGHRSCGHGARRPHSRVHAPGGVVPEGHACRRWIPVIGGGLIWVSRTRVRPHVKRR